MAESVFTEKEQNGLVVAALMLVTSLVYLGALRGGFLYFDDPENVLDNYSIRELSTTNLAHYFTTPLQYMYTPLVALSFAFDYQVGGLDPGAYHITNLGLHLCNILLVYLVCRALTKRVFIARFVTVAFALHPVNVDTVAWISTRSTLLATLFSLASILAYLRYRNTPRSRTAGRRAHLLLSWVLCALAMLSKSTAVVLPVVLLLLDAYRGRKLTWRSVAEKVPFFAVALAIGIMGLTVRVDTYSQYHYTVLDRCVLACSALVAYLFKLLVPYPLAFAYAYPAKTGTFLPWHLYLAPLVLGAAGWLVFRTGVPKRVLFFGGAFFLVPIVLSQSVLLVDNYQANRYAYLPYVGLFLILGHLARRLVSGSAVRDRRAVGQSLASGGRRWSADLDRWRVALRPAFCGLLVVLAVLFPALTCVRATLWSRPVAVLDSSIRHQPDVPFIYGVRGISEYRTGAYGAALRDFDRAVALDSNYSLGYYYRGVLKAMSGDHSAALVEYDQAIAHSHGFGAAYNGRGKARWELGDYPGALADLSQAIAWDAYFVDAYLNRGQVYHSLGDHPRAIADYTRALELLPANGEGFSKRADARLAAQDLMGACADWRTSLALGHQPAGSALAAHCGAP